MEECYFQQSCSCNFTKSGTTPDVFFAFFKLFKWYIKPHKVSHMTVGYGKLIISLLGATTTVNIFFPFAVTGD